jgi:DNA-directed RNA polymerase subunit N (RpoN/RPB10)
MNEPVACPNCQSQFPLEKLRIYKTVLKNRYQKMMKENDPLYVSEHGPIMGDVLDALGYERICCRKTIMSYRTMQDVIHKHLGYNIYTNPDESS